MMLQPYNYVVHSMQHKLSDTNYPSLVCCNNSNINVHMKYASQLCWDGLHQLRNTAMHFQQTQKSNPQPGALNSPRLFRQVECEICRRVSRKPFRHVRGRLGTTPAAFGGCSLKTVNFAFQITRVEESSFSFFKPLGKSPRGRELCIFFCF